MDPAERELQEENNRLKRITAKQAREIEPGDLTGLSF